MVTLHATTSNVQGQSPPLVRDLEAVFASLDDAPLLQALIGPTRRGPKGHPTRILWYCLLVKYHMGLASTDALIRELTNNPWVAGACGIPWPDGIPHKSTFSRFFAKLSRRRYQHLVKDVSRRLVRRHYATLPGFGRRVALDSTTLKGWVNGGKARYSDLQAGWSVKNNTHGKTEFTLGWKLHLLVDCEYELPIAAHVSPGNTNDSVRASNVFSQARFTTGKFHPRYIMAGAGYSGTRLFQLIRRQYDATPIIQVNRSHRKKLAREYQAEQTPEWKALYKQRQAVERAFSRLKVQRALNKITVRGLAKVTVHCYLSIMVLQYLASPI